MRNVGRVRGVSVNIGFFGASFRVQNPKEKSWRLPALLARGGFEYTKTSSI